LPKHFSPQLLIVFILRFAARPSHSRDLFFRLVLPSFSPSHARTPRIENKL
jgi:hypothetical protein